MIRHKKLVTTCTALSLLAVFAVIALYFTRRIPVRPPGSTPAPAG